MKCPTCDGTGEVADETPRDMEKYCDAEVPCDENAVLECLVKGPPHEGPHRGVTGTCCGTCGALEVHAEWCTDMTAAARYLDVGFDDDGWYWIIPPGVATG